MNVRKRLVTITTRVMVSVALLSAASVSAEEKYPSDYKPSKPAASGNTNVLARMGAVTVYLTDKVNAAGGQNSPLCYRNCMTTALNEVLKCTEMFATYEASESCEVTGAQKMHACNPQCQ